MSERLNPPRLRGGPSRSRLWRLRRQVKLPLIYKDEQVGDDLQLDVWVEGKVVVENKHVKELLPVHEAQLMTYLKLTQCRVGLLFNFHSKNITRTMKRIVL